MAYELLFSRVVAEDKRVVFSDVPIVASSVMIEIGALDVDIRRVAGWVYPVILSAPGQFERQYGSTLLFGRSRIVMPDLTQDIFLELFPQYGLRNFVISVFSGFPEVVPPPPIDRWVRAGSASRWYALTDSVLWESLDGSTRLRSIAVSVVQGYVDPPSGFVVYRIATGQHYLFIYDRSPQVGDLDAGSYAGIANNGGLPL